MVRSALVALVAIVSLAPTVAAVDDGRVDMPTSIMAAIAASGGAAFLAVVFAATAPRPEPGAGATRPAHTTADYVAGLTVVGAVALFALAQFLPWGALEFVGGDSQRTYPWGYGSDIGDSGSWFGVDGAGHIDLKVALVLHYAGLVALLPVILMVWRRPEDTKRTASILAGLAAWQAIAFFFHMDGAAAAMNDTRFGTSWGGWLAMVAIVLLAGATLIVARWSGAVRPAKAPAFPGMEGLSMPTGATGTPGPPSGWMPTGPPGAPSNVPGWATGIPPQPMRPPPAGRASGVLDRAQQPQGQGVPRWAGVGAAARPQQPTQPLPPAPWDLPKSAPATPPAQPPQAPTQTPPPSDLVKMRCPSCQTVVEAMRGVRPICPKCGFGRP